MSQIRSLTELVDETNRDLIWRRRELSELRELSFNNKESKTLKRSLILLSALLG